MQKKIFFFNLIISNNNKKLKFLTFLIVLIAIFFIFSNFLLINVNASFNPNLILSDQTLNNIPQKFSSSSKIQEYLVINKSFLANYQVSVNFESNDIIIANNTFASLPSYLQPKFNIDKYKNGTILFSQLIWDLATDDLGNSCSLSFQDVCINNRIQPINPGFILALIQKESGLIFGTNAKLDPNLDGTKFLLDRIVGYLCFETSDKSKGCWDENPEWKYFKGVFRQLFYAIRFLRIKEKMCADSKNFGSTHNNNYKVGNTLNFDNINVTFGNAITCALYYYTPHVYNSQFNFYNLIVQMEADKALITPGNIGENGLTTPICNIPSCKIDFKTKPIN